MVSTLRNNPMTVQTRHTTGDRHGSFIKPRHAPVTHFSWS
jgi:hypothetical protein